MEVLKMPWRPDPDPYAPGRREFLLHEELERRLEQAINAAVEEEREACARIADEEGVVFCDDETSIAARIRARSASSDNGGTK